MIQSIGTDQYYPLGLEGADMSKVEGRSEWIVGFPARPTMVRLYPKWADWIDAQTRADIHRVEIWDWEQRRGPCEPEEEKEEPRDPVTPAAQGDVIRDNGLTDAEWMTLFAGGGVLAVGLMVALVR